jgi:hypothetical protein
MAERLRTEFGKCAATTVGVLGLLAAQFVRGRYPTRRFVVFAIGIVALCLPFMLAGVDGSWIYPVVGLPMLWIDWRHETFFWELKLLLLSRADIPPGERVRLRTALPVRRFNSIEIVATDRGIRWAARALSDAASTLGLAGRTAIEFSEIQRLERAGNELRIWTDADTYSTRLFIWDEGRGNSSDEWIAYLEEKCPGAEFTVREPETARNSRLLKPAVVTAIALAVGIPYGVFLAITLRDAGWL